MPCVGCHFSKYVVIFIKMCRLIRDGHFGFEDYFQSLCDSVEGDDFYLLSSDFGSYLEAQVIILVFMEVSKYSWWCYITQYLHGIQAAADKAFSDPKKWTQMSILSTAGSGRFSSDRTIRDYAEKSWGIEPCRFPSEFDG